MEPADMVAAAGRGDASAEAALCERFLPLVRVFAARRLRGPDAIEDFSQDALLLLLEAVRDGRVDEPEHIGAFVLGICRNMARHRARLSERRKALWERFGTRVEDTHTVQRDPSFSSGRLEDCVTQLSKRARRMLQCAFFDGMTSPEIGELLEISPANARVLRHRTLAALRTCLQTDEVSYASAGDA